MNLFTKLFGLYYKLIYLCSAIRMNCVQSDLTAEGRTWAQKRVKQQFSPSSTTRL